jgi:hypothetical protein
MKNVFASHRDADHWGNLRRCAPYRRGQSGLAEIYSLADWTTIGFAISFFTAASVAWNDRFSAFLFIFAMRP